MLEQVGVNHAAAPPRGVLEACIGFCPGDIPLDIRFGEENVEDDSACTRLADEVDHGAVEEARPGPAVVQVRVDVLDTALVDFDNIIA